MRVAVLERKDCFEIREPLLVLSSSGRLLPASHGWTRQQRHLQTAPPWNSKHVLRVLALACLVSLCAASSSLSAESLLLVGKSAVESSFVGTGSDGTWRFHVGGRLRNVSSTELVRWSTVPSSNGQSELILSDGSRLVLAETWTGKPSWQITDATFSATTKLFGSLELPRSQVRAILLKDATGSNHRTHCFDQQLDTKKIGDQHQTDLLCLINGDRWEGQFASLAKNEAGDWQVYWSLDSSSQPMELPLKQIAAILLVNRATTPKQKEGLMVGLRDGSLLRAESLVADAEQLRVRLASGVELTGSDASDVVHLRSMTVACAYLSDREPSDFQHLPYLDLPCHYRQDRNVLGSPLLAGGRIFAKGLGMLPAARLTYRLDAAEIVGRYEHFVAEVAIDDAAGRGGSVIFRVYLEQNGNWQLAYASPIVRGGDPPLLVSVELGDAQRLALVTDFADRGDELDYANWLDARLE